MPTRPLLMFFALFLVIVLYSVSVRGQSGSAPAPTPAPIAMVVDAGVGSALGSNLGAVAVDAGLPAVTPAPSSTPTPPAIDDPLGEITSFYGFVRSGKALPAVGAALMLAVWGIRKILPGSWSKSTIGGYVIGFGASLILFVASALVSGASVTLGLILQALGTAAAASGLWEHVKDLLAATGSNPPLATPAAK